VVRVTVGSRGGLGDKHMPNQREYERKLRIGMVGVGSHTYRNLLPSLNFLPVTLVAICDRNRSLAEVTAAQYGVGGVYETPAAMYAAEKLDAVLIAVGEQQHPELVCEAFEAGLHVWVEKPVAMSVAEVDDMIARRGSRVCVVGYKKAFMPSIAKAIEFFADKANGPLTSMSAHYPVTLPPNGRQVLRDRIQNNWLANGCHPLSAMLAVGGPVESADAHVNTAGEGALIIRFATGAIGTLLLAMGAGGSAPIERYVFHGQGCTITIDNSSRVTIHRADPNYRYGQTVTYLNGPSADVWEPQNAFATLENMPTFTQGIYFELEAFCRCVLDGTQPTIGSLEFAREVMRVYEAALGGTAS